MWNLLQIWREQFETQTSAKEIQITHGNAYFWNNTRSFEHHGSNGELRRVRAALTHAEWICKSRDFSARQAPTDSQAKSINPIWMDVWGRFENLANKGTTFAAAPIPNPYTRGMRRRRNSARQSHSDSQGCVWMSTRERSKTTTAHRNSFAESRRQWQKFHHARRLIMSGGWWWRQRVRRVVNARPKWQLESENERAAARSEVSLFHSISGRAAPWERKRGRNWRNFATPAPGISWNGM